MRVNEHVRDSDRAFGEVHRVLKPGGVHVFSIPFAVGSRTEALFDRVGGEIVLRAPIEYHGTRCEAASRVIRGSVSNFGNRSGAIGFDTRIELSRSPRHSASAHSIALRSSRASWKP
jgi:hypothetical protein